MCGPGEVPRRDARCSFGIIHEICCVRDTLIDVRMCVCVCVCVCDCVCVCGIGGSEQALSICYMV